MHCLVHKKMSHSGLDQLDMLAEAVLAGACMYSMHTVSCAAECT